MPQLLPIPAVSITTRLATLEDLAFIDGLQKKHSKALGYFPTKQLEEYIATGGVLIAEQGLGDEGIKGQREQGAKGQRNEAAKGQSEAPASASSVPLSLCPPVPRARLGYIISRDRYLKRDELGVIFQLCVVPGQQRKLIGAALVQSVFERSAYGCRLYCCWCAQDLEANHFWESLGFVPIAFRAGSRGKKRVHIFWEKRMDDADSRTGWWYPFQTSGGAIRADRLVFPIPPGTHWRDVESVAIPTGLEPALPAPVEAPAPRAKPRAGAEAPSACTSLAGFQFQSELPAAAPKTRRAARPKKRARIDPRYSKAARELRDRYLEQLNHAQPTPGSPGKYAIGRHLPLCAPKAFPRLLA